MRLRYTVTLVLYEVEKREAFLSHSLVQCAFEYISTKPKLLFIGYGTGVESLQTSPGTVGGAGQSTRRVPAVVKTCLLCSKGAGQRAHVLTAPQ